MSEFSNAFKLSLEIKEVLSQLSNEEVSMSNCESIISSFEKNLANVNKIEKVCKKFEAKISEKDPVTLEPRFGPNMVIKVGDFRANISDITLAVERYNINVLPTVLDLAREKGELEMNPNNSVVKKSSVIPSAPDIWKRSEPVDLLAPVSIIDILDCKKNELVNESEFNTESLERKALLVKEKKLKIKAENRRREEERKERIENEIRTLNSFPRGTQAFREALIFIKDNLQPVDYCCVKNVVHDIVVNICSKPDDEKLRRLHMNHPKLQENLFRHNGAVQVFIAMGFKASLVVENISVCDPSSSTNTSEFNIIPRDGDTVIGGAEATSDTVRKEYVIVLQKYEPNPEESSVSSGQMEWITWYDELTEFKQFLES